MESEHNSWTYACLRTWRVWAGCVWATLLCVPSFASARDKCDQMLEMTVGEQTRVPASEVQSYSEGVQGIVDVRLTPRGDSFVLVAQKSGLTTLLLIYKDGRQCQFRVRVRSLYESPDGVQKADNVRLDFYFVQLSRSYNHNLGVGWPSRIGGTDVAGLNMTLDMRNPGVTSATAVVSDQALPQIDLLQVTGWAKISRQGALIAVNGESATYRSGGELNVIVTTDIVAGLQRVRFGSEITVLPNYDEKTGRIELAVQAEFAELDDDRGTGVPSRVVSEVVTKVNLEKGQAIMLAGLNSEVKRNSKIGLPGLSQIPVIGALFGTRGSQREEVQNVIFIVPTILTNLPTKVRQQIEDTYEVYRKYSGDFDGVQVLSAPKGVPSFVEPKAQPVRVESGGARE